MPQPDFPVVGVVGGGQLARMMAGPAEALGVGLRVLAAPGEEAAPDVVRDTMLGRHDDLDALRRLASGAAVVTFDHEHVPPALLAELSGDGTVLRPGPGALLHAQDKVVMRQRLSGPGGLGVPAPPWTVVRSAADLVVFGEMVGWPVVLKVRRGGYDGRGVMALGDAAAVDEAAPWLARAGSDGLLAEARVDFDRELTVLVARSPSGQAAAYPVVETVQENGICRLVVAPAPSLDAARAARATRVALDIAGALDVTGVLAVEMFETGDDVVVNELAMRPHNSGHWTSDGAVTGQFEQHVRAVLDLPLGDPRPTAPWTVMANILGGDPAVSDGMYPAYRHVMARDPGARVHLYGKSPRPGRKIGHVSVSGADLDDVRRRAEHAAGYLAGTIRR